MTDPAIDFGRRLHARLLATLVAFAAGFAADFGAFGASFASAALMGLLFLLTPVNIWLARRGEDRAAAFMLIFSAAACIAIASLGLPDDTLSELFCAPAMLMAFVLLGPDRPGQLLVGALLTPALWAVTHFEGVFAIPGGARRRVRPSQIGQVLLNLLGNAYDAVEGRPTPWVSLEARSVDGMVRITVTDCGNGIAPDVIERMMQPFFTTKPVGRGTGLGLSISSGIVDQHGGRLSYDDSGPNTRFTIEWPRRQPRNASPG